VISLNIKESIIECLAECGIDISRDNYVDEIDSVTYVSCLVELEQKFEIVFPDEYLAENFFEEIDKLVSIIEALVQDKDKG
jgi:acyl carrier protein